MTDHLGLMDRNLAEQYHVRYSSSIDRAPYQSVFSVNQFIIKQVLKHHEIRRFGEKSTVLDQSS